jgi:hypothetical protein
MSPDILENGPHEWSDGNFSVCVEYDTTQIYDLSTNSEVSVPDQLSVKIRGSTKQGATVHIGLHGEFRYFAGKRSFRITDLTGNGEDSGNHNLGYGTLAVRVMIQCLVVVTSNKSTLRVCGRLSPGQVNTPESISRRAHFWSRLATLEDSSNPFTKAEATVEELVEFLPSDAKDGLDSRFVNLKSFWPKDEPPLILPGDREALNSIDINEYALPNSIQNAHQFENKIDRARIFSIKISIVSWLIVGALFSEFMELAYLIPGVFAGASLTCVLMITAINVSPWQRRVNLAAEIERVRKLTEIKLRSALEEKQPGISRRLYDLFDILDVNSYFECVLVLVGENGDDNLMQLH